MTLRDSASQSERRCTSASIINRLASDKDEINGNTATLDELAGRMRALALAASEPGSGLTMQKLQATAGPVFDNLDKRSRLAAARLFRASTAFCQK